MSDAPASVANRSSFCSQHHRQFVSPPRVRCSLFMCKIDLLIAQTTKNDQRTDDSSMCRKCINILCCAWFDWEETNVSFSRANTVKHFDHHIVGAATSSIACRHLNSIETRAPLLWRRHKVLINTARWCDFSFCLHFVQKWILLICGYNTACGGMQILDNIIQLTHKKKQCSTVFIVCCNVKIHKNANYNIFAFILSCTV